MNASSVPRGLFAMVMGMAILSCTGSHVQPKAIYLVASGWGQLSESDLRAHPEVIVANSQQELANHVESQVAIWIDKNAVKVVDLNWLQSEPQKVLSHCLHRIQRCSVFIPGATPRVYD